MNDTSRRKTFVPQAVFIVIVMNIRELLQEQIAWKAVLSTITPKGKISPPRSFFPRYSPMQRWAVIYYLVNTEIRIHIQIVIKYNIFKYIFTVFKYNIESLYYNQV